MYYLLLIMLISSCASKPLYIPKCALTNKCIAKPGTFDALANIK